MNAELNADEIVRALRDGYTACADCPHYGEPRGCNRPDGTCDAWGLGQDAASLIESQQAEIEKWRERHNQAALNFQQENRENQKLQAQLAASRRRERAALKSLNVEIGGEDERDDK